MTAGTAGQDVVKLIGILAAVWLYGKLIVWAARKTAEASDDYELDIDYDKLLTATSEEVARRNTALKLHRVTELPEPKRPTMQDYDGKSFALDADTPRAS